MSEADKTTRLAEALARTARTEGRTATAVDGVEVFRADGPSPLRCSVYDPCLIMVAQGRKCAYLGGEAYEYSPAKYLVLPLSLPLDSRILEASPERPFLSFAVRIDPVILGQLVLDAGPVPSAESAGARGIAVSEMTAEMVDAALRLVGCFESDVDARVLAPQIVREILFRVLTGPQGGLLHAAGRHDGRIGQVGRALRVIHASYAEPIDVPDLARAAHMSLSSFYDAFRTVTSLSPLQYVKEIRLARARQILLWEGVSAKRAARRVGYSSPSQFSREFKRRFGRPPGQERAWARASGELAVPAPD